MTLSIGNVYSGEPATITTTREHLLDLIDEIASRWDSAPFDDAFEEQQERVYLELWRKTAREALKRTLPYLGSYRRDIPAFHRLAEYTFPRKEYDALERCLVEIREQAGLGTYPYRLPTQLPYIGLGWMEDPLADGEPVLEPHTPYSEIMIHLCLTQKTQFLFEQVCRLFGRNSNLGDYLVHPFRQVALELVQVLEEHWMTAGDEDDSDVQNLEVRQIVDWQEGILREIELGLNWAMIKLEIDTRTGVDYGTGDQAWNRAGQVLNRILRENLDFARQSDNSRSISIGEPAIHVPLLTAALERYVTDGQVLSILQLEHDGGISNGSISTTYALGQSRNRARLNRRQAAIYWDSA